MSPHPFPSPEWVAAYGIAINASEGYRAASLEWTHGPVALIVPAHPEIGVANAVGIWLDLDRGACREARVVAQDQADRIQRLHGEAYGRQAASLCLLPGAQELLDHLSAHQVPYAIATSGRLESARHTLKLLKLSPSLPIITRDLVRHAKPDPDLFVTAAQHLNIPINHCVVVGDSVWDMLAARRAWALGVGLLSGGYGQQELERAGAYRVYQDPADLLRHLDEVGLRLAQ